jgi:Peptidase C13 family
VAPSRFTVNFDQVAVLGVLVLAVWAALDRLHAPRAATFTPDALFGWACYVLLALIACALTARTQSRAADTRTLLVPALAVAPFVLTIFWLAGDLAWIAARPLAATVLAVAYVALLALRILGASFGPLRLRPALVAVALIALSPGAFGLLNLDTRLWVSEETAQDEDSEDPAATEELFYDQPARIAAAVARVAPSRPGKPAAYFVGFAGDGAPGVFRREAQFAAQAFGARYGSGDRTVLLINDEQDRDSYPLASVSGLAQALKLLAARMDPEQDVLVLFLTSHGSQDGLEVENGSLPLGQLAPADLRQALDESGIKWRLVIVSACYAGVFIDALRDDTTAIVTAADAGHSSFGCDEDRELTWFGEAFLKDALPGSASLEEAFATAAKLIARREQAGHEVHSNPQLYIGARMREKLRELPPEAAPQGRRGFTVRR